MNERESPTNEIEPPNTTDGRRHPPSPPPYPPPEVCIERSFNELQEINERLLEEIRQVNFELDQLLFEKSEKEKVLMKSSDFWREKYTRMMLRCFHHERSTDWFCSKLFLKGEDSSPQTCPICLSHLAKNDEIVGLHCQHWLCEQCWFTWEDVQQTCPFCRSPVLGAADLIVFRLV